MSSTIDNIIAYRILHTLVTPFNESKAFKHGIIDKHGKQIKFNLSIADDEYYNLFYKLIFNIKKLINKLPGGESYTKNIIAGYYLINEEAPVNNTTIIQDVVTIRKKPPIIKKSIL